MASTLYMKPAIIEVITTIQYNLLHHKTAEIEPRLITWVLAFGGALLLREGQLFRGLETVLATIHLRQGMHHSGATSSPTLACL